MVKNTPADNKKQQFKKALIEALEKSLGVVTTACKNVGVDRTTFYKYYNNDPEFKAAVDGIDDIALDFVESQNYKLIKEGNPAATIFYLKTKGKRRGYIEGLVIDQTTTTKTEQMTDEELEQLISKLERIRDIGKKAP